MMGFAFGGLAVLSAPRHLGAWSSVVEIRSMFLALFVSFVLIVLAYVTNPSESSFRAFLTEQSFRHHLTRLDDAQDDHQIDHRKNASLDASTTRHSALDSSPFQFADRASVSLRTPKHFFRTFGVFSVAAVLPTGDGGNGRLDGTNPSMINNSWFIGAFGMWWWAAHLDGFWRDVGVIGAVEGDDTAFSGILEMKAIDRAQDRHVLPSNHQGQSPNNAKQQRSRERLSQHRNNTGNGNLLRRSSSPPPLPRSASLPLHAKRTGVPSSNQSSIEHHRLHGSHSVTHHSRQQQAQTHPPMPPVVIKEPSSPGSNGVTTAPHASNGPTTHLSSPSSKSPAVAFPDSPQIAKIKREVDSAQTSVTELQEQLNSAITSSASNSATTQLQVELEQQRARKQADDTARTEIRNRTRALEDSKRHAESSKREAEKRLKSAQGLASGSDRRMSTLSAETNTLRAAAKEHSERADRSKAETDALCNDLNEELEGRKGEVKEVEDLLTVLVRRVKELEAKVAEEEYRLQRACEEADEKKHQGVSESLDSNVLSEAPVWPLKSPADVRPPVASAAALTPMSPAVNYGLSSDLNSPSETSSVGYFARHVVVPKRSGTLTSASFAPFSPLSEQREDNPISPMSSSFIPGSLIESLGINGTRSYQSSIVPRSPLPDQYEQCLSPMSRSFQSDDDVILDRRDSTSLHGFGLAPGSGAPSAFVPTPASLSPASPIKPMGSEQADMPFGNGSASFEPLPVNQKSGNRRTGWFAKDRKGQSVSVGGGLNPDAKEFSLPKDRARTLSFLHSKPRSNPTVLSNGISDGSFINGTPSLSYDSKTHTPDSSGSSSSFAPSFEDSSSISSFSSPAASIHSASATTPSGNKLLLGLPGVNALGSAWFGTSSSSQNAFAPTPTEREVLTRAFTGGSSSKNASMDHLPIIATQTTTSPQALPAVAVSSANNKAVSTSSRFPGVISRPAWLDSLRGGGKTGGATAVFTTTPSSKSLFSPFDEEEMVHEGRK